MWKKKKNIDWAVVHGWRRYKKPRTPRCKFCDSYNVIKYGHFKGWQQWWCKDCQRKFSASSTLPRMRSPADQTLMALKAYYNKGMPLRSIRESINKKYSSNVSEATVYRWIDRVARLSAEAIKNSRPKVVGDKWIANESTVKLSGKEHYLLDIMDLKTRFILTTMIVANPDKQDIKSLLQSSVDKAAKAPRELIVLAQYNCLDKIDLNGHADFEDILITVVEKEKCPPLTKRYFPFSKRSKLLSRLRKKDSIQKILDGWTFHYNFRKEHKELSRKSPAEKAGLQGV